MLKLIVKISDTGIGMDEEFKKKMFGKFERETDTRLNAVSGYGLGLTIAKQLVDLMGGEIFVDSVLGKGSVFTVEVDLKKAPHTKEITVNEKNEIKIILDKLHLLVADDNMLNREVLKEILKINGISCDMATDGAECIKLFKENPDKYSSVLLDVLMPNMDGYDTAKTIRALEENTKSHILIIAMTANTLEPDIKKCLDSGMNKHLSKPIDVAKLLNILSNL